MINFDIIEKTDPEIHFLLQEEYNRQQRSIELIASENVPSEAVMLGCASYHGNKYAEGYPNARYYGGCYIIDQTEQLAIDRACELFDCKYANVQPHSGTQANMAAEMALCPQGGRILSFTLNSGGHLSHGAPVSFSGKLFNVRQIDVGTNYRIDYDKIRDNMNDFHPNLIIVGFSAYPRTVDYKLIREIVDEYNSKNNPICYYMADIAHISGLVACRTIMSPMEYADVVTTTTQKMLRGPRGGLILCNDEEIAKKIDKAVFPMIQGGPLENIILSKAICFKEAMSQEYKGYIRKVLQNAKTLENSFKYLQVPMIADGTETHMIILDLSNTPMYGSHLQERLEEINIITNKNAIPFDDSPKTKTNGLRIGTPAVTSRGMGPQQMEDLAFIIWNALQYDYDERTKKILGRIVDYMTRQFPLP